MLLLRPLVLVLLVHAYPSIAPDPWFDLPGDLPDDLLDFQFLDDDTLFNPDPASSSADQPPLVVAASSDNTFVTSTSESSTDTEVASTYFKMNPGGGTKITCVGDLPGDSHFPPEATRSKYRGNLHFLCAYIGGAYAFQPGLDVESRNLGCGCAAPGVSSDVFCHPPPYSWHPLYHSDLLVLCELSCFCSVPRTPPPPRIEDLAPSPKVAEGAGEGWYAYRRADGVLVGFVADGKGGTHVSAWLPPQGHTGYASHPHLPLKPIAGQPRLLDPRKARWYKPPPVPGRLPGKTPAGGKVRKPPAPVRPPNGGDSCPARCDGWKCGASCSCSLMNVGPKLWQPGYCISVFSGLRGFGKVRRRRGSSPSICACNGTYVSAGCCGAVDGLVWEATDLWLGKVK